MNPLFSVLFLIVGCEVCSGQQSGFLALGKVTDARTNKGIKAEIWYSSIPTGAITGRFDDSTFSFTLFGTAKYQITAEARGYNPRTIIVDPRDIGQDNRVLKNIQLVPEGEALILRDLIFPQGKASIDKRSYRALDEVAEMMKQNERIEIMLEGHTDNTGSPKANHILSEKRVNAVKRYLVSKGVSKKRISTRAFGGTQPLRNEMTEEGKALNRRVEMRILKN